MEDNKIVFDEYGIEFTDEDFEGVDIETLIQCRDKIDAVLKMIEQ